MNRDALTIRRLDSADATQIVDCFVRVYGHTYANDQFYDASRLAELMQGGMLNCVGGLDGDGRLVGHMAMSRHERAASVELGNTVVDPSVRGGGVAWKIGAELSAWCIELGYRGYLHYPTTNHHIMQRHSVERGFETGLMFGYIPAETDGKVNSADIGSTLRQACTIVYQPLIEAPIDPVDGYLPSYCSELLEAFAGATGLQRRWQVPKVTGRSSETEATSVRYQKRDLQRLHVLKVGEDFSARLASFDHASDHRSAACCQIDFSMSDAGLEVGIDAARDAGYWFCGWLPGFADNDVFRLQKVDQSATDLRPNVVNPVAQSLLGLVAG